MSNPPVTPMNSDGFAIRPHRVHTHGVFKPQTVIS
jgi:hypothetical protein